ncbi:MAG: hypothetical protein WKG07_12850 [Hymenobacter sp.]
MGAHAASHHAFYGFPYRRATRQNQRRATVFVDSPNLYHADLVAAAQRELRSRGAGPASAAPPAAPTPR